LSNLSQFNNALADFTIIKMNAKNEMFYDLLEVYSRITRECFYNKKVQN